jgi:hypothetical protein
MVKVGAGVIVREMGRDSDNPPPVALTVRVKLPAGALLAVMTVSFDWAVPGAMLAGDIDIATPCGAPLTPSFSEALKPFCTDPQLTWVNDELLGFRVILAGAAAKAQPTGVDMVSDSGNVWVTVPPVAEIRIE